MNLQTFSSLLNSLLLLVAALGAGAAFFNAKRTTVVSVQKDTIDALQVQIDALKGRQDDLEKENTHLRYVIETIQLALKQKGIAVTIDGDLVTISDGSGTSINSTIRRRPRAPEKDS